MPPGLRESRLAGASRPSPASAVIRRYSWPGCESSPLHALWRRGREKAVLSGAFSKKHGMTICGGAHYSLAALAVRQNRRAPLGPAEPKTDIARGLRVEKRSARCGVGYLVGY
jgi:hypothetical protein